MGIIVGIVAFLFVIVSILLSIIILLQDSKGEGLASSAFGGEGMQAMLGGRGAATFLSKLTAWLAIGFMVMALFLMRFYGDTTSGQLKPLKEATQSETVAPGSKNETNQKGKAGDQATATEKSDQTSSASDTADTKADNAEGTGK
ncbi:preprotein translocase subunit SecG [Candidatus Poribacteria bacterium]|nr:preprotein translocase subunit SecG [Candidatus Poribacteria bacterium]